MARVVKRYANRKLYDTTTSRYVALDDISGLIRSGEEVEVTDNETGADLTAVTLAQIILEEERRHKDLRSLAVLRELVRSGGDAISNVTSRGMEALGDVRGRVSEIVTESTRPAILDEVLSTSRRQIEDLQRRVDQGIRQSVERLRSYPGIGAEVERLEGRVRDIENRIRRLLAGENGKIEDAPGENPPPTRSED